MTPAEREERILSLEPLVKYLARNRAASLPVMIRVDELISAAWVGAIEAVDRYKPEKNVSLAAYAKWRISGSMGDYLRSIDPVSRDERRKLKADENAKPPITMSIHAMHPNDQRVFNITDKRSLEAVRRINARLTVAKVIGRAGVKKRHLRIVLSHAAGETMKSIGRREGVNESRISQICKETLLQLRAAA